MGPIPGTHPCLRTCLWCGTSTLQVHSAGVWRGTCAGPSRLEGSPLDSLSDVDPQTPRRPDLRTLALKSETPLPGPSGAPPPAPASNVPDDAPREGRRLRLPLASSDPRRDRRRDRVDRRRARGVRRGQEVAREGATPTSRRGRGIIRGVPRVGAAASAGPPPRGACRFERRRGPACAPPLPFPASERRLRRKEGITPPPRHAPVPARYAPGFHREPDPRPRQLPRSTPPAGPLPCATAHRRTCRRVVRGRRPRLFRLPRAPRGRVPR